MRIVIDMQGAQSLGSRDRGIGRYTSSLVKTLIKYRVKHELVLVLSDFFSETIEPIRAEFGCLLGQENIHVWKMPGPVASVDKNNSQRKKIAELTYEAFIKNLRPDFIFITSLFEGFSDDAVTCVNLLGKHVPVAVVLYDLIPFINPDPYLLNPQIKEWYLDKIEHLRRADLLLAISESARQESIQHLNFTQEQVINISTDADDHFEKITLSDEVITELRQRYGLCKPFVMYTGGIDHRKNVEGLIRAYASLPVNLRVNYQLAIVCSVQPATKENLLALAKQHGLSSGELILTGFVSEQDLLTLYNLCHLFVFPSKHEGFGLPALEAMRCGAAVIASNTSSLPEVIGWPDALFDPHSDAAIAHSMQKALTDENYRNQLIESGLRQANVFSWDKSAKCALAAMEEYMEKNNKKVNHDSLAIKRLKLAYVSPLPPAQSGIADYSAELLPELAKYYDIDVIVEQADAVTDNWIILYCPIRSVAWFIEHAEQYDRVIYHFGNSHFHSHMFDLIEIIPGLVVLHDFYLAHVQAARLNDSKKHYSFNNALLENHGHKAIIDRSVNNELTKFVWEYPINLSVLQRSLGVIVHGEHSIDLAKQWYGNAAGDDWSVIPLMRKAPHNFNKKHARKILGIGNEDIITCSFGILGPNKLNHRLLQAWLSSPLANDPKAHLIFVGQNDAGEYGDSLRKLINGSPAKKRIYITGWANHETFHLYLSAADIGVQLRTLSRGETSAAVLDCMNYGLATIVNAHGSMVDLDPDGVWMLDDKFADTDLINALTALAQNKAQRIALGKKAQQIINAHHNPEVCAKKYFDAIEMQYQHAKSTLPGLLQVLAEQSPTQDASLEISSCLANDFPVMPRSKQLLIDISELVQRDAKTGIQRVVRAILHEWLNNLPAGFKIEPVYATTEQQGYRYARRFMANILGLPSPTEQDPWVDCWNGDIFVGLDLQHHVVAAQTEILSHWRNRGVKVCFVVYDLLPIFLPSYFAPQEEALHSEWLKNITKFDGCLCISKAVADELNEWCALNVKDRLRPLAVEWFHLGADIDASAPSKGLPDNAKSLLDQFIAAPTFLMVGTLEPRKGHSQVLAAFEVLWQQGVDVNLVLVGKQGWQVDALIAHLKQHPQAGKKLHWLEGISDEFLDKVYANSTCLILASYGEGFGLPLIEAAQHNLPIFARDIPVFREVAGEHAEYFTSQSPEQLANAIGEWLVKYKNGTVALSENMPWLTWQQSAQQLVSKILPST